jgi:uncharacterized membrane protein YkvA (DUF1232 family)
MTSWRQKVTELKIQTYALYLAYRDPRVPWYARGFIALVVAYAFSPIDLIPDFIPVLGYLDDFVLIPLGVTLAIRMIPTQVMEESRAKSKERLNEENPRFRIAGIMIISLWVIAITLAGTLLLRALQRFF